MSELTAGTSRIGETVTGSQWRLWLGRGLVAAIGMVLLLALMVVITVVDYMRYIG